jgi:DNA-binding PadR family transcriptional regulator
MNSIINRKVDDHLPLKPLELSVLLVLCEGPEYGYGIVQRIADEDMGAIRLAPSNLYYVLDRMLTAGLVTEAGTEEPSGGAVRRRYYAITPLGRSVAEAEAGRLAAVVRTAGSSATGTGLS